MRNYLARRHKPTKGMTLGIDLAILHDHIDAHRLFIRDEPSLTPLQDLDGPWNIDEPLPLPCHLSRRHTAYRISIDHFDGSLADRLVATMSICMRTNPAAVSVGVHFIAIVLLPIGWTLLRSLGEFLGHSSVGREIMIAVPDTGDSNENNWEPLQ